MADWQLTTPVVLIIFNRPDTTEKVFRTIAEAKPPKLLVMADGPRPNHTGEAEKCAVARAVIERVDWDCEVLTNYADTNMGLKKRVSSGLCWAFEQVDEAIILEDDCLPHPTFFRYCEELLTKYRHDTRIGAISGSNFQRGRNETGYSYYFSRYFHCWGWATWGRSCTLFDSAISLWPQVRDDGWLEGVFERPEEVDYWSKVFESLYGGKIDSWAYAWVFMSLVQNTLNILPTVNLVSNIGFGPHATHTTQSAGIGANTPIDAMQFPMRHPPLVIRHAKADSYTRKEVFEINPLHERAAKKLLRRIRSIVSGD